jgi:hypothetical protein
VHLVEGACAFASGEPVLHPRGQWVAKASVPVQDLLLG